MVRTSQRRNCAATCIVGVALTSLVCLGGRFIPVLRTRSEETVPLPLPTFAAEFIARDLAIWRKQGISMDVLEQAHCIRLEHFEHFSSVMVAGMAASWAMHSRKAFVGTLWLARRCNALVCPSLMLFLEAQGRGGCVPGADN